VSKTEREKIIERKVLFVDFNGVISYDTFWASIQKTDHPLHSFYEPIEELLFVGENRIKGLVDEWMLGEFTSEKVHQIIVDNLGAPYQELFDIFVEDCKRLDISRPILQSIQALRKDWYCVLRTDNMDTFHRFTLPANPYLAEAFDEVHSSYLLRQLKKSDGGAYYTETVKNLNSEINNCVLIDDSLSNCRLFEKLGGRAYCPRGETEVISALENLRTKI